MLLLLKVASALSMAEQLTFLEVSYPNMGYVPVSQGISSLCGRDFFYLQRVGNLIDVEKVKFW